LKIIINADDFGHDADTVRETIACFESGLLTSATIMANMPATPEALDYARSHPQFSFGVHLTLTGDGSERPLSLPDEVPGLVTEAGTLPPTRAVRIRALLDRLSQDQLEHEIAAQVEWVQRHGVDVVHVDSHRHLHKFVPVRRALDQVLPRLGIRCVRNVQDVYLTRPLTSPTYWLGGPWRRGLMRHFRTTDHFYMPTSAGDSGWDAMAKRLSRLEGRTLEVGLHPGSEEPWRARERASLRPFVEATLGDGHELITWHAISRG